MWLALALFAVWMGATYALEGAPRTLLRPEAAGLRMLYTGVANLLIDVVGGGLMVRHLTRQGRRAAAAAGFGSGRRSVVATAIGLALGTILYLLQGAPSLHPVVLVNGSAQVLPVSSSEQPPRRHGGTIAFHNFLALFGVLRALGEAGTLGRYETLQAPLLVTATVGVALLLAVHRLILGKPAAR